jgi:hypothetical protein
MCGQIKPISQFYTSNLITDTLKSECRTCLSAKQKSKRRLNPGHHRAMDRRFNIKYKFGITLRDYESLLSRQNGVCAICKRPETSRRLGKLRQLGVDHSHSTGTNRGLLCSACNVAIGYFGESIELLEAAIKYLKKHTHSKSKTTKRKNPYEPVRSLPL